MPTRVFELMGSSESTPNNWQKDILNACSNQTNPKMAPEKSQIQGILKRESKKRIS